MTPVLLSILDEGLPPRHYHLTLTKCPYDFLFGSVSIAKFCPACQRVWATIRYQPDKLVYPDAVVCEHCDATCSRGTVPGSLFKDYDDQETSESLVRALPFELLLREFHLQLKAISND